MVKRKFFSFIFFLGLSVLLQAHSVQVEVSIDSKLAVENEPLVGKIIVLHPESESIDDKSFTLEGKPLKVQLLSKGRQSSISIINGKKREEKNCISCYTFQIQGQGKGQHQLKPISFKVGNDLYHSTSSKYEVHRSESHDSFTLEAILDAPKKIFPGQRFKTSYRLYLKTDIEPIAEYFPLLEPKGCSKIGERQIRQIKRGGLQIIEFTQLLEAKEVGEVQIDAGYVEGFAFQEDFFFRRVYKKPKLKAEAKPLSFKIEPFPTDIQRASFSGALGKISMDVQLLSSPRVCVGDKIKLKFSFTGDHLETLKLPNFALQKPFKNRFRFHDLPQSTSSKEGTKEFIVEIRPMQGDIQAIPPFTFTYFDLEAENYEQITSQAIPIEIQTLEKPQPPTEKSEDNGSVDHLRETESFPLEPVNQSNKTPPPIEIAGLLKFESDLIKTKETLWIWPWVLSAFFLLSQIFLRKTIHSKRNTKSEKLFQEARKYSREPQKYLLLIEKAFCSRLMEEGWLKKEEGLDKLSDEGLNGQIKRFIEELYQQLFSKYSSFDFEISWSKAKELFKRIGDVK